jgi:hypothetical protein
MRRASCLASRARAARRARPAPAAPARAGTPTRVQAHLLADDPVEREQVVGGQQRARLARAAGVRVAAAAVAADPRVDDAEADRQAVGQQHAALVELVAGAVVARELVGLRQAAVEVGERAGEQRLPLRLGLAERDAEAGAAPRPPGDVGAEHAAVLERLGLLREVDQAVAGPRVAGGARRVGDRRQSRDRRLDHGHVGEPRGGERGDEPLDERGVGPVRGAGMRDHQVRLDRDGERRARRARELRCRDDARRQPGALEQPVECCRRVVPRLDEDARLARFPWTGAHRSAGGCLRARP